MRHNRVHYIAASIALLLAACENEPTKPETLVGAVGAETIHFKSRGPTASVFFVDDRPAGVLSGFLQVSLSETGSSQQTFLFYDVQRCDHSTGDCVLLEQGFGLIPTRDLVAGPDRMRLRTNTSEAANPDFLRTVGSGGPIRLQWTQTSGFTSDFHSHSNTKFQGLSIEHFRVAGTSSSAFTEGAVLRIPVSPANSNGTIGTIRSGSLLVLK
jgi:hypothetical protein